MALCAAFLSSAPVGGRVPWAGAAAGRGASCKRGFTVSVLAPRRGAVAKTPPPSSSSASSSPSSSSPPSDSSKSTLKVGQVVAVQRGSAKGRRPELAVVTGAASSGETVDVQPLEAYVDELYVESKSSATFEKAGDIRAVPSEYVPSQNGWIVLNQDIDQATNYFKSRPSQQSTDASTSESVVVTEDRQPLSEDALKRQFFTPSRTQAFLAATLAVPLAAALYAAFSSARDLYQANPAGADFLHGDVFRSLVLFATAGGSLASLVVGSALFLYALSKTDDS